jgi:bis(5'-nucleosyl)-tetraphosphatase (symmetrical)
MATYAIGDIHGCYAEWIQLLEMIHFDPKRDQLWLTGDMINRGLHSLKVMMFILEHQTSIRCVLGNHELHFLAVVHQCAKIHKNDTFGDIIKSSLLDEIIYYLLKQPLALASDSKKWLMVHAGIHSTWTLKQTLHYSNEISDILQSSERYPFFLTMYGNHPRYWRDDLKGYSRLRIITNILTRMRFCCPKEGLNLNEKGGLDCQSSDLIPWFCFPSVNDKHLIFGHWASLKGECSRKKYFAVDTGCIWKGALTALRLEDQKIFRLELSSL